MAFRTEAHAGDNCAISNYCCRLSYSHISDGPGGSSGGADHLQRDTERGVVGIVWWFAENWETFKTSRDINPKPNRKHVTPCDASICSTVEVTVRSSAAVRDVVRKITAPATLPLRRCCMMLAGASHFQRWLLLLWCSVVRAA